MKNLMYLLLLTSIIFTSCEKTIVDPPAPPVGGNLSNDIVRDTTFKKGVYVIDGTIRVRNATVTIEPGTVFRFTDGSAFDVAYWSDEEAAIIAKGTKDQPILFTSNSSSPSNSSWDGFRFFHGTHNTVFDYCTFEYGGGSSSYSMIYMDDCPASFSNCHIQKTAGIAVRVINGAYFDMFQGNVLNEIESYPMEVYADQVHTISGSNSFTTSLGILIPNDQDFDKQGDFTWSNQGVPYYVEGTIRFGAEGTGSVLHIAKGTEIRFMESAQWDVAYWDNKFASIIAEGTADEPIVFTSASLAPSAGDWKSINLFEGTINTSFDHCVFKYGGKQDYYDMLYVQDASVGVTNCQFSHAKNNAIWLDRAAMFSAFGGNTFSDNGGYSIAIRPNYVHTIIGENVYDAMGIFITNDGDLDIKGAYTWTNQNTPYTIEGQMRVGAQAPGVQLTIEPGTMIKFYEGAKIDLAYSSDEYASLIADGTAAEPIIFTSAKPVPNSGDWKGIWFNEGTSNCVINNCIIDYAGNDVGWDGALYLDDAGSPLTLSNTLISNSGSNGISVDGDDHGSSVDYSNNVTFQNIAGVDYYVR